jgi:hypothetical protein
LLFCQQASRSPGPCKAFSIQSRQWKRRLAIASAGRIHGAAFQQGIGDKPVFSKIPRLATFGTILRMARKKYGKFPQLADEA